MCKTNKNHCLFLEVKNLTIVLQKGIISPVPCAVFCGVRDVKT